MDKKIYTLICLAFALLAFNGKAQVNTVEFGKNRIQYTKFKWTLFKGVNFDTYCTQNGNKLGVYVSQAAEEELKSIETFVEYSLHSKIDIFVYNNYDDYKQTNIGLGRDWQQGTGGITQLPNNKMVLYFTGNHNELRKQIRQSLAKVLLDNQLFGDDVGEFAENQALLDLPKWLTDGYISYAAEHWSAEKDDELKNEMLNGEYKSFYQFSYKRPTLAGHSFWQYIAEKYKPDNVTYFLYLSRIYKSLNAASTKICKKKFKQVLADFMEYQQNKYFEELRGRRNQPKGSIVVTEYLDKATYYRFQVNPKPRNNNYVVVEYKKGIYSVKYFENFEAKTLLHKGVRVREGDINPNYPILAWDVKGTKILCIYPEQGKLKMFVYDVVNQYKSFKQEITAFNQITDANFMLTDKDLVLSAVNNGQTDIYTYNIETKKAEQLTNDVFDDLNPVLVSFPNRTGVIYASNRPSANAVTNDTVLAGKNKYNIFLVDIFNKLGQKQITQLTNLKYGNASFPMPYNTSHFTYISTESGIANRWAGFFTTQQNGLDTLYHIGDEALRNASAKELDSVLYVYNKKKPDSISYYQVYKDSAYSFPITNYQSSLTETRVAGNNGQVSEARREGDFLFLYKLKVNEQALYRRNVTAKPTGYMKNIIQKDKEEKNAAQQYQKSVVDTVAVKYKDYFQSSFNKDEEEEDEIEVIKKQDNTVAESHIITKIKKHEAFRKFAIDNMQVGFTNNVLINRFMPYNGGYGPITPFNGNLLNNTIKTSLLDLTEDIRLSGGFRTDFKLVNTEVFVNYQNYTKRLDWGATLYRSKNRQYYNISNIGVFQTDLLTHLYQGNISYPIDETKRIQITAAIRRDNYTFKPLRLNDNQPIFDMLGFKAITEYNFLSRIEYVFDNTLNPVLNIWNGTRAKAYIDYITPGDNFAPVREKETFNLGCDIRHYVPIYNNCIWALRGSADFSWGGQKIAYFLGGVDGWLDPKFNSYNKPANDQSYTFQALALNMRGYKQNIANGNNAIVINSEVRMPIMGTIIKKPINNAFVRNLQFVQFLDLGTAWNGKYNGIQRPTQYIAGGSGSPLTVKLDVGGLGPFAAGYGFGARSMLFGYFVKYDVAWPMIGFFKGKPLAYLSIGVDF